MTMFGWMLITAEVRTWRRDARLAAGVAHQAAPRAAGKRGRRTNAQLNQWGESSCRSGSSSKRTAKRLQLSQQEDRQLAARVPLSLTSSRRYGCRCRP